MPKKKRPSRLAWFAMDVDAFLEDDRMQGLTNREKASWALMLIRSFRTKGMMPIDPQVVAEQTGTTKKEATDLLTKLYSTRLLVQTPDDEKVFDGMSNRMAAEYEMARQSYDRFSNMGKESAERNGINNLRLVKP